MKLLEFNAENCPPQREGKPSLQVNQKTGLFTFNKFAIEGLKLKPGQLVVIHQDEEDAANFYVEIVKERGFLLKDKKAASPCMSFSSTLLARKIGDAFEETGSYTFNISVQPTAFGKRTLYGLLLKPKQ